MRVGLVCPYAWDTPGGVAVHIEDLRTALTRLGHEAIVLAPAEDEDALPDYVTSGGKPISISSNGSVAKINFGPGAATKARRWIKESDLDVLHVHEPVGPTLSILSIWVADGPIVATWHSSLESSRRDLNAMAPDRAQRDREDPCPDRRQRVRPPLAGRVHRWRRGAHPQRRATAASTPATSPCRAAGEGRTP